MHLVYQLPMAADRKGKGTEEKSGAGGQEDKSARPPYRVLYMVTKEIREGLAAVLDPPDKTLTTNQLSDMFLERYGHRVDPSTWTNMKAGKFESSQVAFHLAEMLGLPRPPMVHDDPDLGMAASEWQELKLANPDMYDALRSDLHNALGWARKMRDRKP